MLVVNDSHSVSWYKQSCLSIAFCKFMTGTLGEIVFKNFQMALM